MSLEEYEDMMKTKAKIIDDLYYEDEVIEDYLPGGEVVRRKTGKRIRSVANNSSSYQSSD